MRRIRTCDPRSPTTEAPTVNAPATAGFLAAATIVDNNTPSVVPKLATPIVKGAGEVGTSLIQASGLVRTASVTAVQNTLNSATGLSNVPVGTSIRNGIDGVTKSVIGDSTVKKVTPIGNGLGIVTGGPTDTVSPVKRLGAIQTVTQTTANAIKGVATAAGASPHRTNSGPPVRRGSIAVCGYAAVIA